MFHVDQLEARRISKSEERTFLEDFEQNPPWGQVLHSLKHSELVNIASKIKASHNLERPDEIIFKSWQYGQKQFQLISDEHALPTLLTNISQASPSEFYASITLYRPKPGCKFKHMYIIETQPKSKHDVRFYANDTEVSRQHHSEETTSFMENFEQDPPWARVVYPLKHSQLENFALELNKTKDMDKCPADIIFNSWQTLHDQKKSIDRKQSNRAHSGGRSFVTYNVTGNMEVSILV